MNRVKRPPELQAALARLIEYLITRTLFTNKTGTISQHVSRDGIFYWHYSQTSGEVLLRYLSSIGAVVFEDHIYRLAIRADAVAGFSKHVVEKGADESELMFALCTTEDLKTTRKPHFPSAHSNDKSIDLIRVMNDLAMLGYADALSDGQFVWTDKIAPAMQAAYEWDEDDASWIDKQNEENQK
ncbi:MAG: hypothetical protein AAFW97_09690 [Pseudomonadota bacterium]